jgi:RES domain
LIFWRVLPWRANASTSEPGGALWFPRELQGAGRHDNPDLYGCMYAAEDPVSAAAEALVPFRGAGQLTRAMLIRSGLPLALAQLEYPGARELIDLDDPPTLTRARLRPSQVATNERSPTQTYAARLFVDFPQAGGLRWWSTLEASLINVTLFDRVASELRVGNVEELTVAHGVTQAAGELLGLDLEMS